MFFFVLLFLQGELFPSSVPVREPGVRRQGAVILLVTIQPPSKDQVRLFSYSLIVPFWNLKIFYLHDRGGIVTLEEFPPCSHKR